MEISFNKNKYLFTIFGSLIFFLLVYLIYNVAHPESLPKKIFLISFGIILIVLFSILSVYAIVKLFDKAPGLIVNEQGILDNSNFSGGQLIPWRDILKFQFGEFRGSRYILIFISNPDSYIASTAGFIKRGLLKWTYKVYGTPVSISATILDCDFSELESILTDFYKKYST